MGAIGALAIWTSCKDSSGCFEWTHAFARSCLERVGPAGFRSGLWLWPRAWSELGLDGLAEPLDRVRHGLGLPLDRVLSPRRPCHRRLKRGNSREGGSAALAGHT